MYKIWAKIIKENKVIQDYVVDAGDLTSSKISKVKSHLEEICYELDLSRPIWLNKHSNELSKYNRVHFFSEHFVDYIDFDYCELEIYKEV